MAKGTHANETRAFSIRLRKALEDANVKVSPTVVANEFNLRYWGKSITAHTARAWLNGVSMPMQDKVRTLAEWLRVGPDELRFGPRSGELLAAEPDGLADQLNLQDRELLATYLALPTAQRRTAQEVVAALAVVARQRPH